MNKKYKYLLITLLVIPPAVSWAGVDDAYYGVGIGSGVMTADDPSGESGSGMSGSAVLLAGWPLMRDVAFTSDIEYQRFSSDASQEEINQQASSLSASFGLDYRLPVLEDVELLINGGITAYRASFNDRFTKDEGGFLNARYNDRDENGAGAFVGISGMFDMLDSSWRLDFRYTRNNNAYNGVGLRLLRLF